jgi:hypothetical protein
MLRTWMFVMLLTATAVAGAQTLECYDSERFGNKLINVGDSERRVLEQEPDREVRLENRFGATSGWRYDFYKQGRTVQIYVRYGVVYRICRVPD